MSSTVSQPSWLDRQAYPFRSHHLSTPAGKLHYIDEGRGEPIVFVHGTPSWSFLYRHHIQAFAKTHRCMAMDHLGFGLSDKPVDFPGTPQAHAENLAHLLNHLGIDACTLVVHDFGGPIGLSYAIKYPERIKRIVMFNTWLWETTSDPAARKVDSLLHNPLGNFLYLRTNFSPHFLMKGAFHDKKKLNNAIHSQYKKPFPNRHHRHGLLRIGQSLVGSSTWYQSQWEQIDRIRHKPFLVLWGEKDPFIGSTHLEKWKGVLTHAEIHTFEAGHFVQEEVPAETVGLMRQFLDA